MAHEAPTGWRYDGWCCGGQDCQPIDQQAVEITRDGFLVTIVAGSHITARADVRALFGFDEVRASGDGQYHACILPASQEFRCLYVPEFNY